MHSAPRTPGPVAITASTASAAGLPPVALWLSTEPGWTVARHLADGVYLELRGPPTAPARVIIAPCDARSRDGFRQCLGAHIADLTPFTLGVSGDATLAGDAHAATLLTTGEGDRPTVHVGVLLVDPVHAPHGVVAVFSAPAHLVDDLTTPAAALHARVFAAVARGVHLGAAPEPVKLAPPRPFEVEWVDGGARHRKTLGAHETLGRARDNTIQLADTMASKHHATLDWDGARYVLRDRGSINGTRVDGALIREPTPVGHQTRIDIGRVVMRLRDLSHAALRQQFALFEACEREGLPPPHVPAALGPKLTQAGPWLFSTEPLPAPPLHGDPGVSFEGRDHLVLFVGANGGGTASMQYLLGVGPLRLALECVWPGAKHASVDVARARIAASMGGVRALAGAVNQCVRWKAWPEGVTLEVRALEGLRSWWSPVGGGLARRATGVIGLQPPEVLADALGWVQGL